MVSIATANAYFAAAKHIHSPIWLGFSANQREAGLYQAHTLISRAIGNDVDDSETDETYIRRPDLAVCEQALYMLRSSPLVADGKQPAPKWSGGQPMDAFAPAEGANPYAICAEAMAWLQEPTSRQGSGRVLETVRG